MTFNPNTVVDPVAKYGGRRCRGWPLLAKHFGVEVRATAVVDRCGVGDEKQPCGFDVVDCAKRRRLGGVRVLVTLTGSNVIDAATAERVDDDTLRVRWVPPEAGTYEVSAVLNWLYQAVPQVDAYPSRGDPVYLGPTENRCPGGRCGRAQPFTLDECVKVAAVPLAPKTFTAVAALSPKKPLAPCRAGPGLAPLRRRLGVCARRLRRPTLPRARRGGVPRPAARQGRDVSRRLAGPRCVGGLRPPPEHHGQRAEGSGETFRRRGVDGRERKGCSRPLLADLGPRRCSSRVEQCVLGRATPAIAGLWRCGLLPRSLACCGFEPAAVWESNFTRPTSP